MKETLQKIKDESGKSYALKRITRENDERGDSTVSPPYF